VKGRARRLRCVTIEGREAPIYRETIDRSWFRFYIANRKALRSTFWFARTHSRGRVLIANSLQQLQVLLERGGEKEEIINLDDSDDDKKNEVIELSDSSDEEEEAKALPPKKENAMDTLEVPAIRRFADGLLEAWGQDLTYMEVLTNTRIPLVKLTHGPTNLSVDVSFDTPGGPAAAELMKGFLRDIPMLRPLVLVLKYVGRAKLGEERSEATNFIAASSLSDKQ